MNVQFVEVRGHRSPEAVIHAALLDRTAVRAADTADAGALHALIDAHRIEGRLLARSREEIAVHAQRFIVAVQDDRIVACADLAPLSREIAEIRSLVVQRDVRSHGLGEILVDELKRRASAMGFATVCAFTHAPGYFVELGFSIVPHAWVPEKIQTDCHGCPQFRHCGQYAVVLPTAALPGRF